MWRGSTIPDYGFTLLPEPVEVPIKIVRVLTEDVDVTEQVRALINYEQLIGPKGDRGEKGVGERGRRGRAGTVGAQGDRGDPGVSIVGRQGEVGPPGEIGLKGDKGDTGLAPEHEFDGTKLRFRNPDRTWGAFVRLKGDAGGRGPGGGGGGGRSAGSGFDSIGLVGTDLVFARPNTGPLGPDITVDLSTLAGSGTVEIEDEGGNIGAADTLDFVGAGVVASFAGGTATITIPGGAGDLQAAYAAAPAPAQIIVNAAQPITIELAFAANDVFALRNAASVDILRVSDTRAALTGVDYLIDGALESGAAASITMQDTYTETALFIGGGILSTGTITVTNAVWIWALLQESKRYNIGVNPGFAAFTMFNALSTIANSGNFDLVSALILNAGLAHERNTGGTSSYIGTTVISSSPQSRTTVAGAILTTTSGDTGIRHAKTFNTVALSTVNMGTQRGLHFANPTVALFGSQTGFEFATGLIAVEVDALPFGGNIIKRALRSGITAASNALMFENVGGAASDHGAGTLHFDDNAPVQFGGAAVGSQDVSLFWNSAGFLEFFFTSTSDFLQLSSPASDRFLLTSNDPAVGEINMDFLKGSFGQAGAVGNQKFVWAAKAETITIGGEYSQYLLTQAANDTIDAALGLYAGWTINVPTPTIGTGSLTTQVGLNIGGNPAQASTNRVGLRILSNPAGASGVNAALWITAGRAQFDGIVTLPRNTDANRGAAGETGRIIFNTDDGQLNIDDGTNWTLPDGTVT